MLKLADYTVDTSPTRPSAEPGDIAQALHSTALFGVAAELFAVFLTLDGLLPLEEAGKLAENLHSTICVLVTKAASLAPHLYEIRMVDQDSEIYKVHRKGYNVSSLVHGVSARKIVDLVGATG